MTEKMTKRKECPFCGGEDFDAEKAEEGELGNLYISHVKCLSCFQVFTKYENDE